MSSSSDRSVRSDAEPPGTLVDAEERAAALQQLLEHNEEASERDRDLIRTLKSEISERSANSARLMVQLHKAKVQYKSFVELHADDGPDGGEMDPAEPSAGGRRRRSDGTGAGEGRGHRAPGESGGGRSQPQASTPSPPKLGHSLSSYRHGARRRGIRLNMARETSQGGAAANTLVAQAVCANVVRRTPSPPHGTAAGTYVLHHEDDHEHSTAARSLPVFPEPVPPIRRRTSGGARQRLVANADAPP